MKKYMYDVKSDPKFTELVRVNSEMNAILAVMRMLSSGASVNDDMVETYFKKMCEKQVEAECIRQDLLASYVQDDAFVSRFEVNIPTGKLIVCR